MRDTSVKTVIARKRETALYSTAKFSQPKQNMAEPKRGDTGRENVVNTQTYMPSTMPALWVKEIDDLTEDNSAAEKDFR